MPFSHRGIARRSLSSGRLAIVRNLLAWGELAGVFSNRRQRAQHGACKPLIPPFENQSRAFFLDRSLAHSVAAVRVQVMRKDVNLARPRRRLIDMVDWFWYILTVDNPRSSVATLWDVCNPGRRNGQNCIVNIDTVHDLWVVANHAADLVTPSDVAAVMTVVPREGAAHHALAKRQTDESLNDPFGRAYSECGDARCRVVGVLQRGDCVSLVQGKKYVYWAWGPELEGRDRPRAQAMASCNASAESCNVLTSECFSK